MISRRSIKLPEALIDGDKDGVYENLKVLWDLIQNKPSTFPPQPHQHGDADLLNIDWSKILNKPSTFPPSAHTHGDSDLTGIDWSKILNKPSTFPPVAHQHSDTDITSVDWSKLLNTPLSLKKVYEYSVNGTLPATIDLTTLPQSTYIILSQYYLPGWSANNVYWLHPNGNTYTASILELTWGLVAPTDVSSSTFSTTAQKDDGYWAIAIAGQGGFSFTYIDMKSKTVWVFWVMDRSSTAYNDLFIQNKNMFGTFTDDWTTLGTLVNPYYIPSGYFAMQVLEVVM